MGQFSAVHWVIFGVILFAVYRAARGLMPQAKAPVFCKACGSTAAPATRTRGVFLIEVVLWLCFLVPGLIYSLWRLSTRASVCAHCGSAEVVPADSPVATAARKQLGL